MIYFGISLILTVQCVIGGGQEDIVELKLLNLAVLNAIEMP